MAVDAKQDHRLRLIGAQHLFDPNISRIALRRATYVRRFAYRFVELCSADLTESTVRAGVEEAARQL
jgi:LysR family cys regulon transcriptional activator